MISEHKFLQQQSEGFQLWMLVPVLFCGVLCAGTIGYVLIEDWNWFDAFYMTVITVATVGFSEVHPLSPAGRVLTIVLIFLGVTVFVFATTAVAQGIFRQQFFDFFTERKMEQAINKVSQHVVVCGYGRMSRAMVRDFLDSGTTVVVIDNNPARLAIAKEDGSLVVLGDASQEDTLIRAHTKEARCLVTLIPRDAENLYVAMAARELSSKLYIVCRTEDEFAEKRLLKAGANRVISPYRVGGQKIARAVLKPYVSELVDLAASKDHGSLQIEELKIPPLSPLCGKTIREADLRRQSNVIILSLIKADGTVVFNPNAEESFAADSTVVILGSKEDLGQFESLVLA